MAEQAGSGPVEQEARQLVEAAARWLAAVPDSGAYAERAAQQETDSEAEAGFGAEDAGAPDAGAWDAADPDAGDPDAADPDAGAEQLCRGCPWCRAKAAAGPLGADTLDSIAHLLSAAAESLSLYAQSRRDAHDGPSHDERSAGHNEVSDDSRHHQSDDSEGTG